MLRKDLVGSSERRIWVHARVAFEHVTEHWPELGQAGVFLGLFLRAELFRKLENASCQHAS